MIGCTLFLLPFLHLSGYIAANRYSGNLGWHDWGLTYQIVQSANYYSGSIPFLQKHLILIFYPLALILKLFGNSFIAFYLLHALAGSLSALIVFLICRNVTGSIITSFFIYLSFICSKSFHSSVWHFEVFAMLFLLSFFYFAYTKKRYLALGSLFLALSVKEDVWIYAFLVIAMLIAVSPKFWKSNLLFLLTTALYSLIVVGWAWRKYYPANEDFFLTLWPYGNSKVDVLVHLLLNYKDTYDRLVSGHALDFLKETGFFPLSMAPHLAFFIMPVVTLWANSTSSLRANLSGYYIWPVLAMTYMVLPFALKNVQTLFKVVLSRKFFQRYYSVIHKVSVVVLILLSTRILYFRVYESFKDKDLINNQILYQVKEEAKSQEIDVMHENFRNVAESAGILADFYTGIHVGHSKNIFLVHNNGNEFLTDRLKPSFVFLHKSRKDPYFDQQRIIDAIRQKDEYATVIDDATYAIYRLKDSTKQRLIPVGFN